MAIPELSAPAEIFYDQKEASKYHKNSRINKIQRELTERALEILSPKSNSTFIDVGCGSGISSSILLAMGHKYTGVDISEEMLKIHKKEISETDHGCIGLLQADIGNGLPFAEDSFDYAISISAVQWLFQSYKTNHIPKLRIKIFFKDLFKSVKTAAILQFYCSKKEIEILKNSAKAVGFDGGLVIDNEGTRNVKYFLILRKDGRFYEIQDAKNNRPSKKANKKRAKNE